VEGSAPTRGYRGERLANGRGDQPAVLRAKTVGQMTSPNRMPIPGLKPKDLVGIPWRVAFALQADGWWLRSDVIWAKPNPMPESIEDRPTKAHEYVFLLSKSERYYYDGAAIAEPTVWGGQRRFADPSTHRYHAEGLGPNLPKHKGLHSPGDSRRRSGNKERQYGGGDGQRPDDHLGTGVPWEDETGLRNRRTVWTIATQPFAEAHFAVMPQALVEPCVLASSRRGDVVLDPFAGSGTRRRRRAPPRPPVRRPRAQSRIRRDGAPADWGPAVRRHRPQRRRRRHDSRLHAAGRLRADPD
jgi:hypothetical protein